MTTCDSTGQPGQPCLVSRTPRVGRIRVCPERLLVQNSCSTWGLQPLRASRSCHWLPGCGCHGIFWREALQLPWHLQLPWRRQFHAFASEPVGHLPAVSVPFGLGTGESRPGSMRGHSDASSHHLDALLRLRRIADRPPRDGEKRQSRSGRHGSHPMPFLHRRFVGSNPNPRATFMPAPFRDSVR